jgi:8-oxo-dGTP diphosphatase
MFKGILRLGVKLLFNKRVVPGVPAIIRNDKGEILLGKRAKNMHLFPDYWGLPGGLIEYGETVEMAIKRELREEIGVESEVTHYGKPSMSLPSKEFKFQDLSLPVYCKIKGVPQAGDETSQVKWFAPSKIKRMKLAYDHKKILQEEGLLK